MTPSESSALKTAEYFARLAETYGGGEYYRKRRAAALGEVRSQLKSTMRLLDLGCGNGTYLTAFRESIDPALLAGADLSFPMLREARRHGSSILVGCDAVALPFRPAAWNTIFCSHVLQFVEDLPGCLAEIARCLRADGTLVMAGGDLGTRERLNLLTSDARWAKFREELPRPREVRWRRGLDEYRQAAESAGLAVEARTAGFSVSWPDLAEFYRIRWLPLVESSVRAVMNDLLDEMVASRGTEPVELSESLLFCRKRSATE